MLSPFGASDPLEVAGAAIGGAIGACVGFLVGMMAGALTVYLFELATQKKK